MLSTSVSPLDVHLRRNLASPAPAPNMAAPAAVSATGKLSFQNHPQQGPSTLLLSQPEAIFIFLLFHTRDGTKHNESTFPRLLTPSSLENNHWKSTKEPSLAKQAMTQVAASRNQPSQSQNPPNQSNEDGRERPTNGNSSGLVPPPSAPPALVSAVKSMDSTQSPLATLREKPAATETFDSPYARSTTSTAPGSPRL